MVTPPPVPLHDATDWGIVAVFATVYVGMFLGGLPTLRLDRSGVALLGAIAVIGVGAMSTEQAAQAVDLPTILLLIPQIFGQEAGTALALISTFAGNLLLVGSIGAIISASVPRSP
jgi:Na+/H+ antiporter NhaD/arsenite permease-like protein